MNTYTNRETLAPIVETVTDCLNRLDSRNPDGNGILHFTFTDTDDSRDGYAIDINGLPIPARIICRIVSDSARPAIKRIRYFVSLPRDGRLDWHAYCDASNIDGTAAIDAKPETIARAMLRKIIDPLRPIADQIAAQIANQQSRLDGLQVQRGWLASIGIHCHLPRDDSERLKQYSQSFYYSRGNVTLSGNIAADGTLSFDRGTHLPADLARIILPLLVGITE